MYLDQRSMTARVMAIQMDRNLVLGLWKAAIIRFQAEQTRNRHAGPWDLNMLVIAPHWHYMQRRES
jgi:hypothetical protein